MYLYKNIDVFSLSWQYTSWVCCKCREPNEKKFCWKCGHERCSFCQDGW